MHRRISAELIVAIGVVGLGLFFALQTMAIPVGPDYSRIGPRLFPAIVSAGLILIGLLLGVEALTRLPREESDAEPKENRSTNRRAFIIVGVGLSLVVVLMERAGFVLACSLLFWLTARAFGSRHAVRDAVIAALLCSVVYLGFTRGLDLSLPAGLLKDVF